ncbi:FCD domain-containing protein (plasmid) [Sinorhizobium sp. M103]|uniref:FadR/GntR family transcriptional regulator n=1 Tax=Sinorhizobium sp. M103 TaxID=2976821 RepID=UPI0023D833B9|nr:FCD domain-containing protein [Sinorhizobium sp. M103]WEJ08741.1 FCD domain-containing protein [Sinorhizobium sp. M103]
MKTLSVAGLIDIRHGHGSYVREGPGLPSTPLTLFQLYLQDSTPEMLMELRDIFDRNCTEIAAQRRTQDDLAKMRECINRLKALTAQPDASLDDMLKADLDFHRAIYEASGNILIVTIAEFVLNMVAPWVKKSLDVSGRVRAVELHEQMYELDTRSHGRPDKPLERRSQHAALQAIAGHGNFKSGIKIRLQNTVSPGSKAIKEYWPRMVKCKAAVHSPLQTACFHTSLSVRSRVVGPKRRSG